MALTTIPERKDIPAADRWDLTPLFAHPEAWEADFRAREAELAGYDRFRGRLGESAATLRAALEFDLELSRRLEALYTYAHLRHDEDQADQRCSGMFQRAATLYTRAMELSSFMRPELMALPPEQMAVLLEDPALAPYRFYLEKILRHRPHTLGESGETLLAASREMAQTARQVFGQLDNVDLRFGTVTEAEGREVELSHGNFIRFLMDPRREIRRAAFERYYAAYEAHRHTLAAALAGAVKADLFYARSRRHASCREAALFDDKVPAAVYDNLLATVKANLAPLFRYLDLRRNALKLDALHFYDTYVPLVPAQAFRMPYEEAVETCLAALAPLGSDYVATLERGLRGGWVDRYENRGKRSGAYSSGCYDSPPYILLNYDERSINSLYTLIHEAGHSMHSHYSQTHQPYVYHGYTIFVAEVASTFNEALLSAHLLERYRDDPRLTAFIVNREIDDIRATLFRQTMFADFELRVHALAEDHQPLTLENLTGIYQELLETYFGGHLAIDPALRLECLRIPHFYSGFYVYKYATGISAALALAREVLAGNAAARRSYLEFLTLGGSRYPLEELAAAGVDMTSATPVARAAETFDGLVDRLAQALPALA